jgi:hypothetical protein
MACDIERRIDHRPIGKQTAVGPILEQFSFANIEILSLQLVFW